MWLDSDGGGRDDKAIRHRLNNAMRCSHTLSTTSAASAAAATIECVAAVSVGTASAWLNARQTPDKKNIWKIFVFLFSFFFSCLHHPTFLRKSAQRSVFAPSSES